MTIILGLLHILTALLTMGLSLPLTSEKIPMNKIYGIRIPIAFESDENWYMVNRYGGKALLVWSAPVLLIGIGLVVAHYFRPTAAADLLLVNVFWFTPLLILGAVPQTLRWAKRNLKVKTGK